MSLLNEYESKKRTAEKMRRDADRARGALEHAMELLKKNHDCETVAQAEKYKASLDRQITRLEAELKEHLEEIEREYGDRL